MNKREIIDALNAIPTDDAEEAHAQADVIIADLDPVPPSIQAVYDNVKANAGW
jgi:hypothetical protein